jgi:hypothetical protein
LLEALALRPCWVAALAESPCWFAVAGALLESLPELPWPEPPEPFEPVSPEDGDSLTEDPLPLPPEDVEGVEDVGGVDELWAGTGAPPSSLTELAGVLCWDGFPPVAVGGASEYWIPLESA